MARPSHLDTGMLQYLSSVLILNHLNISDLLQIVKACDKLMSLDLQVPVMKVLAGLEYILKKAQVV